MDDSVRQLVRERAGNRCEYCRLPQRVGTSVRFHVEHIRPRSHGGSDDFSKLALVCPNGNWHKGPNLSAIDPETDQMIPLFDSRADRWDDHFAIVDREIIGLTVAGRAAVRLLRMNEPEYVEVRREAMRHDDDE